MDSAAKTINKILIFIIIQYIKINAFKICIYKNQPKDEHRSFSLSNLLNHLCDLADQAPCRSNCAEDDSIGLNVRVFQPAVQRPAPRATRVDPVAPRRSGRGPLLIGCPAIPVEAAVRETGPGGAHRQGFRRVPISRLPPPDHAHITAL